MNLKTTLVLLVLVVAGGSLFWFRPSITSCCGLGQNVTENAAPSESLQFLSNQLTQDKLKRIEIQRGDKKIVLDRSQGGDWVLPGQWPTRKPEVEGLVQILTGLRSRFMPIRFTKDPPDLKLYGLDKPMLTVLVLADGKEHRLAFSEKAESGADNRFSRPTYLRVDEHYEAIRLGPGIIAALDRPEDYYQQHRLFPGKRVVREKSGFPLAGDAPQLVERLQARSVMIQDQQNKAGSFTLAQQGEEWELREPVRDQLDRTKLHNLLEAVPELWVEQFVREKQPKPLAEYGLDKPEQILTVTRPQGDVLTLLIGKESPTVKVYQKMVVPPSFPGMPGGQQPPRMELVHERFRYAKLQGNDQVFEIKSDNLKDIFVAVSNLRDAHLARFQADDVCRLEITHKGETIVLVKDKNTWRLEKPFAAVADATKVQDLLNKLSSLEARDQDVLDKADPKTYGLDQPASVIKLTVEEEIQDPDDARKKEKKTKHYTMLCGKEDLGKNKLYVRLDGWERVNAVNLDLLPLLQRQPLDYRSRRVLDFASSDLSTVEIQRPDEKVILKQTDGRWQLTAPVQTEADALKAAGLAGSLGNLEAVKFIKKTMKQEERERTYGLGTGALRIQLTFTSKNKPSQTLLLGKQDGNNPEYFAQLDGDRAVFTLKKEIRDQIEQNSLVYRPHQLWQLNADDVRQIRVEQAGQAPYVLARNDTAWKITQPFEAGVPAAEADAMVRTLTNLSIERYEAHQTQNLAKYGLDKPYLRVTLTSTVKKDDTSAPSTSTKQPAQDRSTPAQGQTKDRAAKVEIQERVLLLGKRIGRKKSEARFAKLGDHDTIFVVDEPLVANVDRGSLDLLDRRLLHVDPNTLYRFQRRGETPLTLERQGKAWRVAEAPVPPFPADDAVMTALVQVCADLQAEKFVAYGPKVDLAKYGLDKPSMTITITSQPDAAETPGKKAEPVQQVLSLGKKVEGQQDKRYARCGNGPGVVILDAAVVKALTQTYLDFVNRTLLQLEDADVASVLRRMGSERLEIIKRDDAWQIIKPGDHLADKSALQDLLKRLASLRAERVAAYPAKDLKQFGLEQPALVLTLRLAGPGGKATEYTLQLGKTVPGKTGDRYALIQGTQTVAVLPEAVVRQIMAAPVAFRDRNLVRFPDADQAILERGLRKAVFSKVDGTWKLTAPLSATADHSALDDLVNNTLAQLRADELVADKPDDLTPYGLNRPVARWRLRSGDKTVLDLLIGDKEKKGKRHYAKLVNQGLVFLLDASLSDKLLGEYRQREVWPGSVDAAQIEKLGYARRGAPSLVLKLNGSTWEVEGKPKVKINVSTVNDTLAALAGLHVERYVVDQGGDPNLYGLSPPRMVVAIQTRQGTKYVLSIGHTEGTSKRYYARVADDKDRTDIFVIGEEDAARILRDLTAFTQMH